MTTTTTRGFEGMPQQLNQPTTHPSALASSYTFRNGRRFDNNLIKRYNRVFWNEQTNTTSTKTTELVRGVPPTQLFISSASPPPHYSQSTLTARQCLSSLYLINSLPLFVPPQPTTAPEMVLATINAAVFAKHFNSITFHQLSSSNA